MPVSVAAQVYAAQHSLKLGAAPMSAAASLPGVPLLPTFIPGYNFAALLGFGVDPSADPSTYTLTDVSLDVQQPEPPEPAITIVRGRLDEQSTTMPAECRLQLDNRSGNYSTRRPQSIHWPNVRVGMVLKVVIATAADTFEQFSGTVDGWDMARDATGNYSVVNVVAHGVLQRLGAGNDSLAGALYRTISGRSPIAYWTLEDGADSGSAASAVNGRPMSQGGTISYADAGPAGSSPLPDFNNTGQLTGHVTGASTSSFELDFVFRNDETDTSLASYVGYLEVYTTSMRFAIVQDMVPGFEDLTIFTPTLSASLAGPITADGTWHSCQMVLTQSGSDVLVYTYVDGVAPVAPVTLTGATLGTFITVKGPARTTTDSVGGSFIASTKVHVGHVAVYSPAAIVPPNKAAFAQSVNGYDGEEVTARLARLCAEESVPFVLAGAPGGRTMGPQTSSTLLTLLRECEAVGGGVLEDGVNFGLRYSELESRYNQTATMTPTLNQLTPPMDPVESNQRIRNDVTASRPGGSSARYAQPAGLPYAVSGPGGIGSVTDPVSFNVDTDGVLYAHASWLVWLGTVDADRYDQLAVNFAARTALIPSWLATVNGSRWTVPTTYDSGGLPPDVLLEGWALGLSTFVFAVVANCSPAISYNLAVSDSSTAGRVGSDDTTLAADIDTAAVSFTVALTYAWSAAGGDYPFGITIGAEDMTLNSVVGTTFNVTRGVGYGGYVSAHYAGDPVTVTQPAVAAL
jgi:hypothetical protein